MFKKLKEMADKAELPFQAEYADHYQRFADLIIEELAEAVGQTGKQCAFTTWDEGVVVCTIDKCKKVVETHFKDEQ